MITKDEFTLIDTHVHLQSNRYARDLPEVLKRAAEAGISTAIVPGTDLESSRNAVELADTYASGPCALYAAVGFHPTDADGLTAKALSELHALARHPRVVAIGEIGLDYYWPDKTDRTWPCATPAQQREALEKQLTLAADLTLPVIIHDRDAHEDTMQILSTWVAESPTRTGTLHAYAGGTALLERALDLGFYIGMDGPVTFKKAKELHAVARTVPLHRLLLETDGPYLTPMPYRGRRNEPAYLTYVAERLAELQDTSVREIAQATTANAQKMFTLTKAANA